jgi:hypothetical protein
VYGQEMMFDLGIIARQTVKGGAYSIASWVATGFLQSNSLNFDKAVALPFDRPAYFKVSILVSIRLMEC